MTTTASATPTGAPAAAADGAPQVPADLAERIGAIAEAARGRARRTEETRRVPAATLAELTEAGFFRLVRPRAFGGYETDFDVLAGHVLTLAAACPSTAWACGLFAAHQWLVASFPEQAQHDVWGDGSEGLVCGSYAPTGVARADGDGYRIGGRWAFASGSDGAQWAVCAAFLPGAAEGERGAPVFFLVPAADYTVDRDWDVAGLGGTGSNSIVLDDVYVPAHRTLALSATMSGDTPGAAVHAHNPAFRVPMLANIASCLAAVGVGAAAGALADFERTAGARRTRGALAGGGNPVAGFATVQLRVAEAAASVDAAREVLLRDLRARAAATREGRAVSVEERLLSRRGQAFAVLLASRAVEAVNGATGGRGLALDNPIQRAWRDVGAVSRHISLNWDAVGTMYGRSALGLEPQGQY
ncbi:acyl-CoA dehydrogenase family protein [Nocardiopsis protaetiae]|uniref:hypothetical protein n=1 Tax=Nocardiopsis protaetiae TaxID=3382270 RepID=UPI00387B7083